MSIVRHGKLRHGCQGQQPRHSCAFIMRSIAPGVVARCKETWLSVLTRARVSIERAPSVDIQHMYPLALSADY